MRLSAVVITYNEERNIARCLQSLSFVDELIVFDSGSKDKTCEIAKNYTPHVYSSEWRGYVTQKNTANELATGNWILSVDADEEVSEGLRKEILKTLSTNSKACGYSIPRKTIHSGQWIRHGGWYPNRLVRLFRKGKGYWAGGDLHEFVSVEGPVEELNGDLIHYSFSGVSDQVERNNRYSSLGALQLRKSGKSFSVGKLLTKPLSKFLETFVLKRGFLDGYRGFMISVSAAYSVFLKWAKLWELENGQKG